MFLFLFNFLFFLPFIILCQVIKIFLLIALFFWPFLVALKVFHHAFLGEKLCQVHFEVKKKKKIEKTGISSIFNFIYPDYDLDLYPNLSFSFAHQKKKKSHFSFLVIVTQFVLPLSSTYWNLTPTSPNPHIESLTRSPKWNPSP